MMSANIGVYGLGVMGANLARNFASRGHTVAVFNRQSEVTNRFMSNYSTEGSFVPSTQLVDFVASLESPKRIIMMVPAGNATDQVIDQLLPLLTAEDILIDGGNAHYSDTRRREEKIRPSGVMYFGVGVSGGEEGALKGPAIMPGGNKESYKHIGPLLESIAARVDGEPCCGWVGPDGAGHFVKMVHNGIEYADMQFISEVYDLLRKVDGLTPQEIAELFKKWNDGLLGSYLTEVAIEVLQHTDARTNKPFLDIISDQAAQKGTGKWTIETAVDLGSPVTAISAAVSARMLSADISSRTAIQKVLKPVVVQKGVKVAPLIEEALWVAKVIAYSEGMSMIAKSNTQYGWGIKPGQVISLWRGGCIIRAVLLKDLKAAFDQDEKLESLLASNHFAKEIQERQSKLRALIGVAVAEGVPTMALSSALNYLDFMQQPRSSTALIQGMRDFFGSHTYGRDDEAGIFHTLWSGDRSEVKQG
jgi:6-phosphogluconate dehydrogenase